MQKWLHHISKEERQENKMAGLMSICSGGPERTGPTHAGLGPSLGFKGNIQLDFRLHSLHMLVWKQTSSGFKGYEFDYSHHFTIASVFLRQKFGID